MKTRLSQQILHALTEHFEENKPEEHRIFLSITLSQRDDGQRWYTVHHFGTEELNREDRIWLYDGLLELAQQIKLGGGLG